MTATTADQLPMWLVRMAKIEHEYLERKTSRPPSILAIWKSGSVWNSRILAEKMCLEMDIPESNVSKMVLPHVNANFHPSVRYRVTAERMYRLGFEAQAYNFMEWQLRAGKFFEEDEFDLLYPNVDEWGVEE